MKSVGKQLEAARQGRNWTPEAAAKVTKIRVEQLLDLERDDFTRFPSPAYARGFVRLYSKALGLDDRRMLAQLDGRLESQEDEAGYVTAPSVEYLPQRTEITAPIRLNRIGVKVILVLAAIFFGIFLVTFILSHKANVPLSTLTEQKKPAPNDAAISPTPATTSPNSKKDGAPATPEDDTPIAKPATKEAMKEKDVPVARPASAFDLAKTDGPPKVGTSVPVAPIAALTPFVGKHQLMLRANQTSWVRVSAVERDGEKQLFVGVVEAGRVIGEVGEGGVLKPFEASQFTLKIAVPSAIDVIFDGYNGGALKDSDKPETFSMPPPEAR